MIGVNCKPTAPVTQGKDSSWKPQEQSWADETPWLDSGNIWILLPAGFSAITQEGEWGGDSDSLLTHAESWLCPTFSLAQALISQDLKSRSQSCSDRNKDQPTSSTPESLGTDSQEKAFALAHTGPVSPLSHAILQS